MIDGGPPAWQGEGMEYTNLGRTGLSVSRLCLGTMNFGPETREADSFAIMDRALEAGINFFDTANVYGWKRGEGITEQIIGRWLAQGGRRERLVLATKVGLDMGAGPSLKAARIGFLEDLFVDPKVRGKGIADALIEACACLLYTSDAADE